MSRRKSSAKVKTPELIQAFLEVRGGTLSATDAATRLGISRKTYYEKENRLMQALMEAGTPKPPGRPTSRGDPETERLRCQNRDLQQQVEVLEQRSRIQQMLREADTRAKKK